MPGEENPALRWGLTGAIGLTVIGILARGPILLTGSDLLGAASERAQAGAAAFYLAIGCLSLIAYPAILVTIGILAARGTGVARSGASAGAIAMVFSNLIILLIGVLAPPKELQAADLSYTGDAIAFITSYAFCSLPALLTIAAVFGSAVGSLGGLIGRLFYRDPFEEEDEQMAMMAQVQYPGILPVPGAPGAPYPGIPYPPPPPPGYPPYREYSPYPPEGGAPAYPYPPPAQFALPPGAYPPPAPYPPYSPPAPPAYGNAPRPYAPPEGAYPLYASPPPPDFLAPSGGDDAGPGESL